MEPFLLGAVPLYIIPPGPIHVLFTITVLSTDGSNWILQVKVTLLPIGTIGLGRMDMVGVGTGEKGYDGRCMTTTWWLTLNYDICGCHDC